MAYEWKVTLKRKDGSGAEWKLQCPLMRGEYRPRIVLIADEYSANGVSGYVRSYATLEEAMEAVGNPPMHVGGFMREGSER